MNFGSLNVSVESRAETLMRKHMELLAELDMIENELAGIVEDEVKTKYGTAKWGQSVRYDNEEIVKYLEQTGRLTSDLKSNFVTYDNTGIVNHFKLDRKTKQPFAIVGERRFTITHKKI